MTLLIMLTLVLPPGLKAQDLKLKTNDQGISILRGGQLLLHYASAETPAPEGTNPLYRRSAYIHPLASPGGQVLTRIQPPDHYHHYGIWNPWTRTHFGEYQVDFWNLADGQGTVRFAKLLDTQQDEQQAAFRVLQNHIYFRKDGGEGIAMEEIWEVQVKELRDDRYVVDLTTTLSTTLETGITLEQYRYGGGLGFRATERWGPGNSTVLTSEGKTREEADASHARWVIVEGESSVPQGRSGILFLSHPDNRAHPEPMRMWPTDANAGKENVFFEFCPIRHQEWVLEKGKSYSLKYRMVVFDGPMSTKEAEKQWKNFAQ